VKGPNDRKRRADRPVLRPFVKQRGGMCQAALGRPRRDSARNCGTEARGVSLASVCLPDRDLLYRHTPGHRRPRCFLVAGHAMAIPVHPPRQLQCQDSCEKLDSRCPIMSACTNETGRSPRLTQPAPNGTIWLADRLPWPYDSFGCCEPRLSFRSNLCSACIMLSLSAERWLFLLKRGRLFPVGGRTSRALSTNLCCVLRLVHEHTYWGLRTAMSSRP